MLAYRCCADSKNRLLKYNTLFIIVLEASWDCELGVSAANRRNNVDIRRIYTIRSTYANFTPIRCLNTGPGATKDLSAETEIRWAIIDVSHPNPNHKTVSDRGRSPKPQYCSDLYSQPNPFRSTIRHASSKLITLYVAFFR